MVFSIGEDVEGIYDFHGRIHAIEIFKTLKESIAILLHMYTIPAEHCIAAIQGQHTVQPILVNLDVVQAT